MIISYLNFAKPFPARKMLCAKNICALLFWCVPPSIFEGKVLCLKKNVGMFTLED